MSRSIAYFISPHGFGHASRSSAVIDAVRRRQPDTRFELFTTIPEWFFEQSVGVPMDYHSVATDLGLVQKNSLEEDLGETVRRLRTWIPFRQPLLDELATAVDEAGCDLVVCDISPLGLAVARHGGKPSLLVENFTWDWVYRGYADAEPALGEIADQLAEVFADASRHMQTEPLCFRADHALHVPPITRRSRTDRDTVRRQLGIPPDAPLVMVTMGGVEWSYDGIDARLAEIPDDHWLVVPGASPELRRIGRAVLLPHRSEFYHPDLIQASDAVIGKLGYSTVAEIYDAGVPFGYVPRPTFPESPPVEAWVRENLPCRRIDAESFVSWSWLDDIAPLLELPRGAPHPPDGADAVAEQILTMP